MNNRVVHIILSGAILLIASSPTYSQPLPWKDIGPLSGDMRSLAVHPSSADIVIALGDSLHRTKDGGLTWQYLHVGLDPQLPSGIRDIMFDPVEPDVIYIAASTGFYRSNNGGDTWEQIDIFAPYCLTFDTLTNRILAGADSGLIYLSDDRGISWEVIETGISGGIKSITAEGNLIYVGSAAYSQSPDGHILKSVNGGEQWMDITPASPFPNIGDLVLDPRDSLVIYAIYSGTWDFPASGITKSTDGGLNWVESSNGIPAAMGIGRLVIDHQNPDVMFAATFSGLYRSSNGGDQWELVELQPDIIDHLNDIAIFESDPSQMFLATNYGIYRVDDTGVLHLIGAEPVRIVSLALDSSNPGIIYAAGRGVYKTTNGGQSWETIKSLAWGQTIVMDPTDPDILYLGDYSPYSAVYKSTDGGTSWLRSPLEDVALNEIILAPGNPDIIYAGGLLDPFVGGFFKSENKGASWDTLSTLYVVMSLGVDPNQDSIVYVGTGDEGILKSVDGGSTLHFINNGLPEPLPRIADILIDNNTPQRIYCATSAGIYKTENGGGVWESFNVGLPTLDMRAIAMDFENPEVLYTGSHGSGVFRSIDGGDVWHSVSWSMGAWDVADLELDPWTNEDLFAALYGGAVWRSLVDDLETNSTPNQTTSLPSSYALWPNYPNPYNPSTTIRYELPKAAIVSLVVYNLLGQKIAQLADGRMEPGYHQVHWSGRDGSGREVPSGIYIVRLVTPEYSKSVKTILLR